MLLNYFWNMLYSNWFQRLLYRTHIWTKQEILIVTTVSWFVLSITNSYIIQNNLFNIIGYLKKKHETSQIALMSRVHCLSYPICFLNIAADTLHSLCSLCKATLHVFWGQIGYILLWKYWKNRYAIFTSQQKIVGNVCQIWLLKPLLELSIFNWTT